MQTTITKDPFTLLKTRLIDYEIVRSEAQTQANKQRKPVHLYEIEPGVFGFSFAPYKKGEGHITTLEPE